MSTYTTQLRYIIEQPTQFDRSLSRNDKIAIGTEKLFDFDYPFWVNKLAYDSKESFQLKFVKRYYQREIGFETQEQFKFYLESKLNIIMPRYIKRYETQSKEFNWLWDTEAFEEVKEKEKQERINIAHNEGKSNTGIEQSAQSTSNSENLESDLPQHTVSVGGGVYGTKYIKDDDKSGQSSNSQTNISGDNDSNSKDNSDRDKINDVKRYGNFGSKSFTELMLQYRSSIIDVIEEIIDELEELFMLVY